MTTASLPVSSPCVPSAMVIVDQMSQPPQDSFSELGFDLHPNAERGIGYSVEAPSDSLFPPLPSSSTPSVTHLCYHDENSPHPCFHPTKAGDHDCDNLLSLQHRCEPSNSSARAAKRVKLVRFDSGLE
ncbi:MAG: hypothetical protein ACXVOI_04465 [Tumebacillaceae bacterium]